jgi:hypothetical protein
MSIFEQISIANAIREELAFMQIEEDIIHDTLEGECDIFECIDWLLNRLSQENCNIDALDAYIAKLKARKERLEASKERWRGILLMAVQATGEKSVKRAIGSVSVSNKPIGIATIDETLVPDDYFVTETIRKIDKARLKKDAIANGVPGVLLDNGGQVLRINI